jgi:signal transduction histidine kinase
MPFNKSNTLEYLTKTILDLYSQKTEMPIAYINKYQHIPIQWQSDSDYCSPLCKLLKKINPKLCKKDHHDRALKFPNELKMCHAGLWNIIIPISYDNKMMGYLITGQRRLNGKDSESFARLLNLKHILLSEESNIDQCFFDTPSIDIDKFQNDAIHELPNIKTRLIISLKINEKERMQIINLAHELLLPIQSIIGNAEYISIESNEQMGLIKQRSEEIIFGVTKLGLITENMRSCLMGVQFKPFTDRQNLKKFKLIEIIDSCTKIFKAEADKKGISFLVNINPNIFLPGSKSQIERCFFNLIHNAVKYSYSDLSLSSSRYISINAKLNDQMYIISISNYGIGIMKDEINKVCEVGIRGRLSGDKKRTGSGLGLSEAKKIVEEHLGEFNITSKNMGNDEINSPYLTVITIKLNREIPLTFIDKIENKNPLILSDTQDLPNYP